MRTIKFEEKEYEIEPIGLKERFVLMKKYSKIDKGDLDIDKLEQIYEELITLICNKTKGLLDKDFVIKVVNEDAIKGDTLIAEFMEKMVGDISKKS